MAYKIASPRILFSLAIFEKKAWLTLQLWTLRTRSIYFGRKTFFQKRILYPSNVWFITVIAFNSVGFCRNNYFKIISNAPSNLICNIWKLIFHSLMQFFRCLSNDIALRGLFLHNCVVFSLFCVVIVSLNRFLKGHILGQILLLSVCGSIFLV